MMKPSFGFFFLLFVWSVIFPSFSKSQQVLSTQDFLDRVTACAAGSRIQVHGNLVGSLQSLVNGPEIKGSVDRLHYLSLQDLLKLFPEADRLPVTKLYYQCIMALIGRDSPSPNEIESGKIRPQRQPTQIVQAVNIDLTSCTPLYRSLNCELTVFVSDKRRRFELFGTAPSARAHSAFTPDGSSTSYPASVGLTPGSHVGAFGMNLDPDAMRTVYLSVQNLPNAPNGGVFTVWYLLDGSLGKAEFRINPSLGS